jgi:hypothetical protein
MVKRQLDYSNKEQRKEIIRRMYRAPIKHYVREYGWVEAARKRKLTLNKVDRELRYFTLCSLEAIDIKTLYEAGILGRAASGYPSTFFCERDKELTEEIARIVGSNYWSGAFEEFISKLYSNNDRLRDKLKEQNLFPFDIYNLDFTGSCIPGDQPPYSRTLEALTHLVDLQHKEEQDFDIFLTFRAKEDKDNKDAIKQLVNLLSDNCKKYPEAKKTLDAHYSDIDKLRSARYELFIAIAIPKFLSGIAKDYRYKLGISPSYKYKRRQKSANAEPYYITSMIISLEYIHDKRSGKLSKLSDPPIVDEIQNIHYPNSIIEIFSHDVIDVDKKLRDKPELTKILSDKVKKICGC